MPPSSPRRAGRAELGRLAIALADAFYDDPIFCWLIPSDHRRRAGLRRFFEIELRVVGFGHGSVWTTDELAGAMIAAPPGHWRFPTLDLLRYGPGFTRTFGVHLPRAAAYLAMVERRHLRGPHHYVPYIGVTPESQGQGLGGALLGPTLRLCDSQQLPAYIEASSERSAQLYERHGFVVTGQLVFRGSPPMRLMLRNPSPSES